MTPVSHVLALAILSGTAVFAACGGSDSGEELA
jgi:hypothetical protein